MVPYPIASTLAGAIASSLRHMLGGAISRQQCCCRSSRGTLAGPRKYPLFGGSQGGLLGAFLGPFWGVPGGVLGDPQNTPFLGGPGGGQNRPPRGPRAGRRDPEKMQKKYSPIFLMRERSQIGVQILSRLGELLNTLENVHPRGPGAPRGPPGAPGQPPPTVPVSPRGLVLPRPHGRVCFGSSNPGAAGARVRPGGSSQTPMPPAWVPSRPPLSPPTPGLTAPGCPYPTGG